MASNLKKGVADLQNQENVRARIPRGTQFIGLVEKRLGGSRMTIRAMDGTTIMARVPGRSKKYLWIREGDIVLLEPWEFDKKKADLTYKYKPAEIKQLEKKGLLGDLNQVEEF
jgi:translation initiation factor 1A